jgi:hypothetical protein
MHDKAISVCVDRLWRSHLPGLSAGYQDFGRHDWNREHELRSLAVHEGASIGRNRLDSRFLDGTKLRCCGQWPNTAENQYVVDSTGSRRNVCSASGPDFSQRGLDHVSWSYKIETMSGRLIWSGVLGRSRRCFWPQRLLVSRPATCLVSGKAISQSIDLRSSANF